MNNFSRLSRFNEYFKNKTDSYDNWDTKKVDKIYKVSKCQTLGGIVDSGNMPQVEGGMAERHKIKRWGRVT